MLSFARQRWWRPAARSSKADLPPRLAGLVMPIRGVFRPVEAPAPLTLLDEADSSIAENKELRVPYALVAYSGS